ncbi:MAG: anaerobic ribonucleoside-triphosphate reductase activating protein [Acutalibacteraceae bacterium]
MNYCNIKNCDIANGTGVRVSLFVSGCRNHCNGCFQKETWDFSYGEEFTKETEDKILEMLAPTYINGLTILGGEPFEEENQRALLPFVKRVRAAYPEKDIWVFSGYTLEEMLTEGMRPGCEVTGELLSLIDILVDGRFEEDKKNISLKFRGSENQRIIDLKKSAGTGKIVLAQM